MLVLLEKNYRNLSLISLFRPNMPLLTEQSKYRQVLRTQVYGPEPEQKAYSGANPL
jgi:hypothetical protein